MDDVVYRLVNWILGNMVSIFFRDIKERGGWQIPEEGPLLFAIAPHASQFVDPMLVMHTCPRRISFCMAQKSLDRFLIGSFGRAVGSIPVLRAQDLSKKLNGLVIRRNEPLSVKRDPSICRIPFTEFTTRGQLSFLLSENGNTTQTVEIASIVSENELVLKSPIEFPASVASNHNDSINIKAKYTPHVDHSLLFASVTQRLYDGCCVGIFPEGGSHDRTTFLPFKPGPAIMVLGAMAQHPDLNVKIVPVGLNYFHGEKFRSRAVVEYGAPISVDPEWVKMYRAGEKREAVAKLMLQIEGALRPLSIQCRDYDTLTAIQLARRLYLPLSTERNSLHQLEVARRMAVGLEKFRDNPQVISLVQQVHEYARLLKVYGIRDHMVEQLSLRGKRTLGVALVRLIEVVVFAILALPCFILNLPIIVAAKIIPRRKAAEALKASSVKIKARDVIATWKILIAMIMTPILYITYSSIFTHFLVQYHNTRDEQAPWGFWQAFLMWITCLNLIYTASLISIRIGEKWVEKVVSLKPLYLVLTSKTEGTRLRKMRRALTIAVRDVVEKFAPDVVDSWDENRIWKPSRGLSIDTTSPVHSETDLTMVSPLDEFQLAWNDIDTFEEDGIFFNESTGSSKFDDLRKSARKKVD